MIFQALISSIFYFWLSPNKLFHFPEIICFTFLEPNLHWWMLALDLETICPFMAYQVLMAQRVHTRQDINCLKYLIGIGRCIMMEFGCSILELGSMMGSINLHACFLRFLLISRYDYCQSTCTKIWMQGSCFIYLFQSLACTIDSVDSISYTLCFMVILYELFALHSCISVMGIIFVNEITWIHIYLFITLVKNLNVFNKVISSF